MKKEIALLLFGFVLLGNLIAQQTQNKCSFLHFDNTTWDVGHVSENMGKLTHNFCFVNNHSQSVTIERIVSTCGCVVASYTKKGYCLVKKDLLRLLLIPVDV